jgi:hypothetical protein
METLYRVFGYYESPSDDFKHFFENHILSTVNLKTKLKHVKHICWCG